MSDLPAGYVPQPYPKWIYHPDGSAKVIDSPDQEQKGWYDTSTEAAAKAPKSGEANTPKDELLDPKDDKKPIKK